MRTSRIPRPLWWRAGQIRRAAVPLLALVLLVPAVVAGTTSAGASAAPASGDTGTAALVQPAVAESIAERGRADVWVHFAQRADLSAASDIDGWAERGRYVHDTLRETSRASQAELTAALRTRGVDYEPFWIVNAVLVRDADQALVDVVQTWDKVAEIRVDDAVPLPDPIEGQEAREPREVDVEWGVANIRADAVWSALDVQGDGVVIGSVDTGVEFEHPALVEQYGGNRGGGEFDHNYHWWDPNGVCPTAEPCDNSNHGTHTTGTMVGDDGGDNRIGVAPQAQWIAAKGCEPSNCSLAALASAGQFMLAPTDLAGDDPEPQLRPHIVNNSWGGAGGRDFYDDIVAAWVAAGMFPVFSNGNNGPACGTAGSPADGPHAYGVGAYDSDNQIANFSSRGPGRDGEIRPNVSAPGVDVRSAVVGGYGNASGTSMAAPHVAGAVALLWSAATDLAGDVDATRELLGLTAIDTEDLSCGGTADDNNVYGHGRIDVLGAAIEAAGDAGIAGQVTDADSGAPVAGVRVEVADGDVPLTRVTDQAGSFQLGLLPGSYQVELSRFGYEPQTVPDVQVADGQVETVDAALEPLPTGTLAGAVTLSDSGHGVPGVPIYGDGFPLTSTGPDGTFTVDAPAGSYDVAARPGGFPQPDAQAVTIAEEDAAEVEFDLACGMHCNVAGRWEASYGGPGGSLDIPRGTGLSPDGATVFVTGESPGGTSNEDYATLAYDAATGDERWVARYDGPDSGRDVANDLAVAPGGDTVYVTGRSGGVGQRDGDYATLAYDAATGDQRWVARYDGPAGGADSALAVTVSADGATVFVTGYSTHDDTNRDFATVAYDADTGDQRWVARYDGPISSTDSAVDVVVSPDGENVFVTGRASVEGTNNNDYATVAYDAATGDQRWVARYNEPSDAFLPWDNAQALTVSPDGSRVFVTGYSHGMVGGADYATLAYDADTGDELWVKRYNGPASGTDYAFELDVAPDGDTVYVTGRSSGIGTGADFATVAYEAATGDQQWVARYDGPPSATDIAEAVAVSPDGDTVYVTGRSDGVATGPDSATVAYEAATGDQRWAARWTGAGANFDSGTALAVSPDSTSLYVTGHSQAAGSDRRYTTIAYDAQVSTDVPVFVPWDLRLDRPVAVAGDHVRVGVEVANVGTTTGSHEVSLQVAGEAARTTEVTLAPGTATGVEWSLDALESGRYPIRVGHLRATLRVVGCDQTVTGMHFGPLTVTSGVTCLAEGAQVRGPVTVEDGAGLVATGAVVRGPLTATGADLVHLAHTRMVGPVQVRGTTGALVLDGDRVGGTVDLHDNVTAAAPIVVAGNRITGSLSCAGNYPPPVNEGRPNDVTGRSTDQCAQL